MGSLDVLDYVTALDAALAPHLKPGLRRQAIRDARRTIDAMAFRFAILDDRPLPEDEDILRALAAMKAPQAAALVLARRAPIYQRVRRRRLITTWTTLAIIGLFIGGLAFLATSERSEDLTSMSQSSTSSGVVTVERNFTVTPDTTRLYVPGTIFLGKDNTGNIEVRLIGPDSRTHLFKSYADRGTYYLRENIETPLPGSWKLMVDYNGAVGSAEVSVRGITPTR